MVDVTDGKKLDARWGVNYNLKHVLKSIDYNYYHLMALNDDTSRDASDDAASSGSVTVREIARRVGVSPSTVSRVLNGQVKEAWASTASRSKRIRALAEELNYRPSFHSRAFHTKRTQTIGLLFNVEHPMLDGVYGRTIQGEIEVFRKAGYDLALHAVTPEESCDSSFLLDRRFDAYLVHNHLDETVWQSIQRAELPSALVNGKSDLPISQLRPDDESASCLLTKHLLEQGHRRIAFAAPGAVGDGSWRHYSSGERLAGYRRAMEAGGLEAVYKAYDVAEPAMLVDWLKGLSPRPTGLIVSDDRSAAMVLKLLRDDGVRVPDDLSAASFNDTPMSFGSRLGEVTVPPLTVMRIPFTELGRQAAQLLIDHLNRPDGDAPVAGGHGATRLLLPAELVVRESVRSLLD